MGGDEHGTLEKYAEEAVRFIDRLVDMVPPEHYLAADADTASVAKRAKQRRIDPESAAASTIGLQVEGKLGLQLDDSADATMNQQHSSASASGRKQTLQQRLEERLLQLRSERAAKRKEQSSKAAKQFVQQQRERRLQADAGEDSAAKAYNESENDGNAEKNNYNEADTLEGIDFNVTPGNPQEVDMSKHGPAKRKRGEGKITQKRKLLKNAVERMQRIASDEGAAEDSAWQKSMERAKGQRVHDDPKLLKKSIKRERKKKQKSAQQWAERNRKQQEAQRKRQEKKRANLQQRADKKIARKIEKADNKKKKVRPGFEGRTNQATLN